MPRRKALERHNGNPHTHKRLVFRYVQELATRLDSNQAKPERYEILFSSSNFANALKEKRESLPLTDTSASMRGPEYVLQVIQ